MVPSGALNPLQVTDFPVAFTSSLPILFHFTTDDQLTVSAAPSYWNTAIGRGTSIVEAELFQGPAAVKVWDETQASTLRHGFAPNDVLSLDVEDAQQTALPGLLAIGVQPTFVPLLPSVALLVSGEAIVPSSSISVQVPQLPPGTSLYVQGFGLDSGGGWHGTPSLRALWW